MVNPHRETDRLEYFNDAIIAIAATLLSIDSKAPRADALSGTTLLVATPPMPHSQPLLESANSNRFVSGLTN
jgi:hypothetical protein